MDEENHIEVNDIENNITNSSSNDSLIPDLGNIQTEEKSEEEIYEIEFQNNCKGLNISKEQVSKTLDKYIKNNTEDVVKVNPLYDYVPFNFTIFNYSEEELSAQLNYVKKADSKKSNENSIIDLYNESNTWMNKIVYYWIGLTNNLRHKRKYLDYSEKLGGLETRLTNIQKNFDSQDTITDNLIKDFFSDLYDCYRSLDVFFEDFIKFMCNSRAPIGEFFVDYQLIKDSVFNKCPVSQNELFLNTISHIEVKKYVDFNETEKAIEFCKEKFPDDYKTLEDRLKSQFEKDQLYIEKEKFLFLLREFLIYSSKEFHIPGMMYAVIRYWDRGFGLKNILIFLFALNRLYRKAEVNKKNKGANHYEKKIDKAIEVFCIESMPFIKKEADDPGVKKNNYEITDVRTLQVNEALYDIRNMVNTPEEELYTTLYPGYNEKKLYGKYVSKMNFWKNYNIKTINDINEVIILFFKRIEITKATHCLLIEIKNYMDQYLTIEHTFKEVVFKECKKYIDNFKIPNCFSEKEIWWFYCVKKTRDKNKEIWKNNPIRDFSYYNNYIRYEKNIKRLPHPLSNDVNWDEIGMDVDRLEYSKRHHYFVNECLNIISNKDFSFKVGDKIESKYKDTGKWKIATITNIHENEIYDVEYDDGEKETNIEINSIRSLEETNIIHLMRSIHQQKSDVKELEKKELLQNRIIKTNDVILQLYKMGEFMKEGVLINDQLFFKFILFAINFLIFIGQYFWNNHIEPKM